MFQYLDIKDIKSNLNFRINIHKDFIEDKFYHCFIIIYDCCNESSYQEAVDAFFPRIKTIYIQSRF